MANKTPIFNWQLYFGLVLVVTGGLFLADQILGFEIMRYFWPLLIVLFGVTFFIGMLFAGKKGSGLAIPGAVVTTTGILLFIQNSFDLWVTWTYAWALLISAGGVGMLVMNIYLKRTGLRRAAGLVIGIGLTLFVLFGVFFEIILDIAGTDVNSGIFLGGGLVLLGLFVVFSRPLFARVSKSVAPDEGQADETVVDADFEAVDEMPEPAGEAVEPILEGENFSGLHFQSVGEVFLVQGDTCSIKMEGSEALLQKVQTEIKDDLLVITFSSDIKDWSSLHWITQEHRIQYFITVKTLTQVNLAGAASIQAEKLTGDKLAIDHSGAGEMVLKGLRYDELDVHVGGLGEIRLEGEARSQLVNLSGAGSYKAEDLKSQEANVSLSGAGSARVWVEGELNASLSGAGSIKYKGNPQVEKINTGLGSIKPL